MSEESREVRWIMEQILELAQEYYLNGYHCGGYPETLDDLVGIESIRTAIVNLDFESGEEGRC